eukprot:SAG11_NODE_1211_length_5514_cov_40.185596_2_plen_95_part_00
MALLVGGNYEPRASSPMDARRVCHAAVPEHDTAPGRADLKWGYTGLDLCHQRVVELWVAIAIRYLSRLLFSAVHIYIWDLFYRPRILYLRDRIY